MSAAAVGSDLYLEGVCDNFVRTYFPNGRGSHSTRNDWLHFKLPVGK